MRLYAHLLYQTTALAVAGSGTVLVANAAGQTPPAGFVLRAATATVNGQPQVRVRWTLAQGWLPDGGFNLYRIQNGMRTKINGQPIRSTMDAPTASIQLAPNRQLAIGQLMAQASQQPAGAAAADLVPFGPGITRPASSLPAFLALRDRVRDLYNRPDAQLSAAELVQRAAEPGPLRDYNASLRRPSGTRILPGPAPAPTPAQQTREARGRLIMAAMLFPQAAQGIGLAYDDAGVTAGAQYQYALRTISGGHEAATDAATCSITVGADPQPAAPTGIVAMQRNVRTVDLRWDRLTIDQEQAFGMPGYKVTRVDAADPNGVAVTPVPVIIGALMGGSGHVEPIAFCSDTGVAPGAITYRVTMIDMFGRESPPSTLNFTMEDWATPPRPLQVTATPDGGNVTVAWAVFGRTNYRVYRIDTEAPSAAPVLLTPQPIQGTPVPQALPDNGGDNGAGEIPANLRHPSGARIVPRPRATGPALKWFSFTDQNPPVDHYYKYTVAASFTTNRLDSPPQSSPILGLPSGAPLAVPGGLAARVAGPPRAPLTPLTPIAYPGLVGKGRPEQYGSTVTLTWNAVSGTQPVTYRIYRANATGYARVPAPPPPRVFGPRAGNNSPLGLHVATAGYANITLPGGATVFNPQLTILTDAAYSLIGTTNNVATFTDSIPRSHAHYYRYRVASVSRWGVVSAPAEVSVRVPATAPPSVPALIAVDPDETDGLHVIVRPNPGEEEVTKYHVYRNHVGLTINVMHLNAPGDPAPQVLPAARTKGSAAYRDRVLTAKGAIADALGAGGLRYNIHHASSAYSHLGKYAPGAKGPVVPSSLSVVTANQNVPSWLASLLDPNNFHEVGVADGTMPDANGLVTYTDGRLDPQTQYGYYVVAEDRDGIQSSGSTIMDANPYKGTADPPGPVTIAYQNHGVVLTWSPANSAVGYLVQRSANNGTFQQLCGIRTATTFTDYSARPGQPYTYQVIAVDTAGNVSLPSGNAFTVPAR